ncbi:MAG: FmdB family zinc ribbon protein [Planctomycetota bacterium]
MPIYEYKCGRCGRINEFLENSGSSSIRSCAYCGSKKLQKQPSIFAPAVKAGDSKRCRSCSDDTCPYTRD